MSTGSNTPGFIPPTPYAIEKAQSGISADIQAAIRARIGVKPTVTPASSYTQAGNQPLKDQGEAAKAINAEIKATIAKGTSPAFPTASIAAAVRAADVLLPQELENRVLMIAGLYLNGSNAQTIADKLQLDPDMVKREVAKIDSARSVAYKDNPTLAQKVADAEFDVVQSSVQAVQNCDELLEMILEELRCDFQEGQQERHNMTRQTAEELEYTDENGKKKRRRPNSMFPMKIDSFAKLQEVRGKQLDRLTDIFGLVKKHMPEGTQATVVNNIIASDTTKIDALADHLMRMTGNSIPAMTRGDTQQLKSAATPKTAVTVEAEVVNEND